MQTPEYNAAGQSPREIMMSSRLIFLAFERLKAFGFIT
jgi:hypothetical protein